MKAHAYIQVYVDQVKLKEFGVVKNMFSQNMKMESKKETKN